MWALGVSIAAVVPRLVGGVLVLARRDRLHVALGVAAGALVGVAAFDALPEASGLLGGSALASAALAASVVLGLGVYWRLEHGVFGHVHSDDAACRRRGGHIGAAGLTTHAFIDGLAVGAAFQASEQLGFVVAAAVLVHALSDGLNTVAIVLRGGLRDATAVRWLVANATAPLLGAAVGALVVLPAVALGLLLGFFAGMFVYLGCLSLLPEAHRTVRDHRVVGLAASAGMALALIPTLLA
ncbi:MAG TPA: ZIP family metal transporter [Thermoleophilaceae bacterium]|nr:ZIP family metal transporter [Thermoleophilaceae bacterium]